jgi:hypothetical protein
MLENCEISVAMINLSYPREKSLDDEPRARYAADVSAQGAIPDTDHCGG